MIKTVTESVSMPDEGEVVSDKGVRSIDRWGLCHLRIVSMVGGGKSVNYAFCLL
jgi:hypothetical protein